MTKSLTIFVPLTLTEVQYRVNAAIGNGPQNAITAKDLAAKTKMKPETTNQQLRDIIRQLNLLGVPIVSSSKGFFRATTVDHVSAFCRSLEGRREALQERIDALYKIEDSMRKWVAA